MLLSWLGSQIFSVILNPKIFYKRKKILVSTILDDNVGHLSRSESFFAGAGDGLALVVQHLDGAVHEISRLDFKVGLPLSIDNAIDVKKTVIFICD